MFRRLRCSLAAALVACLTVAVPGANGPRADETAAETEDAARDAFAKGRELFNQGRFAEALPLLEKSHAALPSPNTQLLIARCLRALGRLEEAAARFEAAGADAQARAVAGETKYAVTADFARSEGAAIRAELGVLRVRVKNAKPGTTVETDVISKPVGSDGVAELLHRPGVVAVTVRPPSGPAVEQTATLTAGRWTTIEVELAQTPTALSSSARADASSAPAQSTWMRPTGLALSGAGLLGGGLFVGFGLQARGIYEDLAKRCAPNCGPAERPDADAGDRAQTIANVALGVGAVALVAGVTLIILGSRASPARGATSQLSVTAHGAGIRATF